MQQAEVVIIGGGIIGCSIAYHLARRGCRDVLVLEKAELGMGITATAAGGLRSQFASEPHVRLSLESLPRYRDFAAETGFDVGYRSDGYLFLATQPDDMALFHSAGARQRELGVDVRLLTPSDLSDLIPGICNDGLLGGSYTPGDGHGDVHSAVQGFAAAARHLGATLRQGIEVTGLRRQGERVIGVHTAEGPVAAGTVVNAAGVYARQVGAMAGVDVPVFPFRRDTWISEPYFDLPMHLPTVVDRQRGWTLRREGNRVLMSGERAAHSDYATIPNWNAIAGVAALILPRFPQVADLAFDRGWSGSLDMSPDHHPLLGEHPAAPGLFHACGFSGHCYMHAPAAGRLIADWLLDGRVAPEFASLVITRLQAGQHLAEAYLPLGPQDAAAAPA